MFALCAIAKNEPPHYAEEWLNWHRKQGVDKFFIYDNVGWKIRAKDIEVRLGVGRYQQVPAYNHCLRNCDNADYLGFIDCDEFIMGPVLERLSSVENALALNWKMYGTSGLQYNPYGKQMGVFNCHAPICASGHVKSIVRPSKTVDFYIHSGNYVAGLQEDVEGKRFNGNFNWIEKCSPVWINHYYTRTAEDWTKKVLRGKADNISKRAVETVYAVDWCCTETEDGSKVDSGINVHAEYGLLGNTIDVTSKVKDIMRKCVGIDIYAGEYNNLFGDPIVNKLKEFTITFERNGTILGKVVKNENETLHLT